MADDYSSASAQVSSLEIALSGKAKIGQPLMKRVEALESVILGHPAAGTLTNRLSRLKLNLGMDENQLKQIEQSHSAPSTLAPSKPAGQTPSGHPVQTTHPAQSPSGSMQSMLAAAVKLYQSGNSEGARRAFENVLALYPNSVDACYNLGSLAEKRGDASAALKYYAKAQKLDPNDQQIKAAAERVKQDNYDLAAINPPARTGIPPASYSHPQAQSAYSNPYYSGMSDHHSSAHAVVTAGKHILGFTLKKGLGTISSF